LLDIENVVWRAGKPGGRPLLGPWEPDAVRSVRGLALDATGKLWVAEADAYPKRFSVWDTSGEQGKLVREYFGPRQKGAAGAAIDPLDPRIMFAEGCEWRIDPKTGEAKCLGVVLRRPVGFATYGMGENGNVYLVAAEESGVEIYERVGDGDYKLRARLYSDRTDPAVKPRTYAWADENGDGVVQAGEQTSTEGDLEIPASAFLQDLTVCAVTRPGGEGRIFKVESWSPCGAPRYNLAKSVKAEGRVSLSADHRLALEILDYSDKRSGSLISCRNFDDGRELWRIPARGGVSLHPGSALLAEPVGNVWLCDSGKAANGVASGKKASDSDVANWTLVNQDGFTLARLFAPDAKKVQWPKAAVVGADMSNAITHGETSRLTQAADGKLYLQAGDAAVWNLEVTGLEKVRALVGGQIAVPAPK
jgi:hypothetical protein